MNEFALNLALFIGFAVFAAARLRRYLHIFQQEDYDPKRFLNWLFTNATFDKRVSAALLLIMFAQWQFKGEYSGTITNILVALTLFIAGLMESDPRQEAKKKLVMTQRAARIYRIALACALFFGLVCILIQIPFGALPLIWVVAVQDLPFLLVVSNAILAPFERKIQKQFLNEAKTQLSTVDPTIIAVTGSFGKTSVKHILGHILALNAPSLHTPGSVNTEMGITRIIREKLKRGCKYFLVEMGAYGVGSIAKLCRLTPPRYGMITALGAAHYERFKDLDAVARAKFELAEAVLKQDGKVIVDESVLDQPYARDFFNNRRDHFISTGMSETCDYQITAIEQTADGLSLTLRHNSGDPAQPTDYNLFAPLYGDHHGRNIALAFAQAHQLGIAPQRIILALKSVSQITHRLEVKHEANGVTYIDDAYNSNPLGFKNALAILDLLGKTAKEKASTDARRILVTPGMAELGDLHDAAHKEIGALAAATTDITILVQSERIPSFSDAFKAAHTNAQLHLMESFAEAERWLIENTQAGDVVLLENDLPDLYEFEFRT